MKKDTIRRYEGEDRHMEGVRLQRDFEIEGRKDKCRRGNKEEIKRKRIGRE
jgi:hypothetical protein